MSQPEIRHDNLLQLSILISREKYSNKDCFSNVEGTGKSSALNSCLVVLLVKRSIGKIHSLDLLLGNPAPDGDPAYNLYETSRGPGTESRPHLPGVVLLGNATQSRWYISYKAICQHKAYDRYGRHKYKMIDSCLR